MAFAGQRPHDDQIIGSLARSNTKIGTSGNPVTKALGNLAADLVFTPVAPCRIVDTRNIGGRLAASETRDLNAANAGGNFTLQGGSDTDCGIPANPAALALSVTGLSNLTTGYLRVYPFDGTSAQGSPVPIPAVYTTVTNDMIVPTCQGCTQELKMFSTANTHYAAFVTGYFMAPEATTLDCVNAIKRINLAANSSMSDYAIFPAGYRVAGAACDTSSTSARIISLYPHLVLNAGVCEVFNGSAAQIYVDLGATCCRIPGR